MTRGIKSRPDLSRETLLWLAGLLEGEGSFMAGPPSSPGSPVVAVQMVDEDVIVRAAQAFGGSSIPCGERAAGWQRTYQARLRGEPAVQLMRALRPWMGLRRQAQIDRALASWNPRRHKVNERDEARILRLVAEGNSYRAAGEATGFSYTTVGNVVARNKVA